jgi:hypothetical protein
MNDQRDISKLPRVKEVLHSRLPAMVLLCVLEGGARLLEKVRPPLPSDYGMGFNDDSRVFMSTGEEHSVLLSGKFTHLFEDSQAMTAINLFGQSG